MQRATIRAVLSLVVPAHVTLFSLSDCLLERNKNDDDDENSLHNGHKMTQPVLLAHQQLQGRATDAAP